MQAPRIAVEPRSGRYESLVEAVVAGGGEVVEPADAHALVWADAARPDLLPQVLGAGPQIDWVQLPFAGIENYLHLLDTDRRWTCGKGVYAPPVAEMALAMALAGMRHLVAYGRADRWEGPAGRNLLGARVVILGGGEITVELLRLLEPWQVRSTVVRNRDTPLPGAARTVTLDALHDVLPDADLVLLALALTPETEGVIGAAELALLPDHAWIVNVARGRHIVTDDLVAALDAGAIGGAALDVTDPEPLPPEHPLWSHPRCLITPHVGNTPEMGIPLLAARVTENVRRYAAGDDLLGPVDVRAGY
ncbi:MAG: NAD(P)-dependent oxidoreductase [Acidimicrobiales bacterium]